MENGRFCAVKSKYRMEWARQLWTIRCTLCRTDWYEK